ncbi:MAG: hypothetical protein M1835_006329 [Candelina submexicana]|nr:MAG: hypothetical protein M1835_006329 [Candelina submexicana]
MPLDYDLFFTYLKGVSPAMSQNPAPFAKSGDPSLDTKPYIALSILHYPLPETPNFTRFCDHFNCPHNSDSKTDIANCKLDVWVLITHTILESGLLPNAHLYGANQIDQVVLKFQLGGKRLQDVMAGFVIQALRNTEYRSFRLRFVVTFEPTALKNELDRVILHDKRAVPPENPSAVAVAEVVSVPPGSLANGSPEVSPPPKPDDRLGSSKATILDAGALDCGVSRDGKETSPTASDVAPVAATAVSVAPAKLLKRGFNAPELEESGNEVGSPPKKTKIEGSAPDRLPERLKRWILQYAEEH